VLESGQVGETYNIGGWNEMPNLDIVQTRLRSFSTSFNPTAEGPRHPVDYLCQGPSRPRSAVTPSTPRKIHRELGWKPAETFETGIRKTVAVVSGPHGLGGERGER
jgi:dTDP-glucose 4,6-dehydratase